ncbi:hypothetical protein RBB50_010691 [Rhinocladiella similis]
MKTFAVAAAATMALAIRVHGQTLPPDFTSIPSCAYTPLIDAVAATDCSQTDVACWCANSAWQSTLESKVSSSCTSSADVSKAYSILEETCSLNGVTVSLGSSSSGESTTSVGSSTSSATQAPATSTTTPASSASASSSTASSSANGGTQTANPTSATVISSVSSGVTPATNAGFTSSSVASSSAVSPATYTGGAARCGPWGFPGGWARYPPGRQGGW